MTQTTHPEELLAEYVDGTLAEQDRRAVEAHLAACERCRHEIAWAADARQALARLPEEPVPLGVTGRVIAEAEAPGPRREPRPWGQRIQWAAGVAVAAALVGVVAVSLRDAGGSGTDAAAPAQQSQAEIAGGANDPSAGAAPRYAFAVSLEHVDRDFDDETLRGLATGVADAVRDNELSAPVDEGSPEETQDARDCISTWAGTPEDEVLVRLLRATYEGRDAYVAVYLRGPGAGQPPTRASVWVASADGCQFLDITEVKI
jgi:hypothetical protein